MSFTGFSHIALVTEPQSWFKWLVRQFDEEKVSTFGGAQHDWALRPIFDPCVRDLSGDAKIWSFETHAPPTPRNGLQVPSAFATSANGRDEQRSAV